MCCCLAGLVLTQSVCARVRKSSPCENKPGTHHRDNPRVVKKLHHYITNRIFLCTALQTTEPWAKKYAHASRTRRLQNCHWLSRWCASAPYRQPQIPHHTNSSLLQLYASTLHTAVSPHDVQQFRWQVHSFHTSLSQLVIFSSPSQSICTFRKHSTTQLCDRHCTTVCMVEKLQHALIRHHATKHAEPNMGCTLTGQPGCSTTNDIL